MKAGINQKLLGSFLAGLILFLLSVSASLLVINELVRTTGELEAITRKVELTGDLRLHLHTLLTPVNSYFISGDRNERDNFDRSLAKISGILAELKGYEGDEKWQALAKEVGDGAINLSEKAISALFIEKPVGSSQAAPLMEEINLLAGRLILHADDFHNITRNEVAHRNKAMAVKVGRLKIFLALITVLAIVAAVFLASYISRSITRPILEMHRGAGIIAGGDLSHRLEITSNDEIGELSLEFNRMAESLGMARESLDRKVQELFTLYQVSSVLSSGFETVALLNHIVIELAQQMGIDRIQVFLMDDNGETLYIGAATDQPGEQGEKFRLRVGEGLFGCAVLFREARRVDDLDAEMDLISEEKALVEGVRSGMLIPFGTRGKVSGVMGAFRKDAGGFDAAHVDLLTSVAEHMAIAVENARLYEEARYLSVTDGLTGLHNHRFFRDRFDEEVRRAARYRRPLSVVMMDVDYFKHYNDANGHQNGDTLLRMVAHIIRSEVRTSDIAARYGGEEFVVIAPETDKAGALLMAERIRKAIEQHPFPLRESQPEGKLTVSIGVASFADDSREAEGMIRMADKALYMAKNSGRNRVVDACLVPAADRADAGDAA